MAASGILCQACGVEAPTRQVTFYQNIGMLVMRTHRKISGKLCKNCVHKNFWQMTMTTLFLGPWGTISLIVAPCFIINNLVGYLGALGMPAVPPNAIVPVLDAEAIKRLTAYGKAISDRLNAGEPLLEVAGDVGKRAHVTPGQVVKYVISISQQNRMQPSTGGFPVMPAKPLGVIPLQADADAEIANAEFSEESAD